MPVLNMTRTGKCHHKKLLGKTTDFMSFWILG
jgi:hypothetical protein